MARAPSLKRTLQTSRGPKTGLTKTGLGLLVGLLASCGGSAKTTTTAASVQPAQPTPIANTPTSNNVSAIPNVASPASEPPTAIPADLPPFDKTLDCERDDGFGPSYARSDIFEKRYGATAAKFSDVPTTITSPLEACGIRAALFVLTDLTCDDGSKPFPNEQVAHASRRGSMGSGGRCGSIIDLYKVPCPKATYDVHVDMYFCEKAQ